MIKRESWVCVIMLALSSLASAAEEGAVPLTSIVADVSKRTGLKFLVDPRVRADVLIIGDEPSNATYADLLMILQTHGFAALEGGRYVHIVPDAIVRRAALPLATGKTRHEQGEYVNRVIPVRSIPAAFLVPILRPLLPQQAHLAAMTCTNVLLMVDTYANVRRIEQLVQTMDTGETLKPECTQRDYAAPPPPREDLHLREAPPK
jgi:general secretion pathway protein D